MKLTTQIANQFREVYLNGKWIANTNLKEQLSDLTWEQATTKVGSLNSIAILTFHLNYYIAGLIKVFEGGPLDMKDKYSFDLPPITSQEDWDTLFQTFCSNAERYAELVEQMSDEKLLEPFIEEKYGNNYRNITATIEHGYYHFGQVVIIKKQILEAS